MALQSLGAPWMGNDRFIAVLFYATGDDPMLRTGGTMSSTRTTKILWWVAESGGAAMELHGRSTSGSTFTQLVPSVGGGQHPSIVNVPSVGCWTLRATIGSKTVGAVTVPVEGH